MGDDVAPHAALLPLQPPQVIRDTFNPRVLVEGRNMVWKHVKMQDGQGQCSPLLFYCPIGSDTTCDGIALMALYCHPLMAAPPPRIAVPI